jgi:quinol monooxygenase YgiN
MMMLLSMKMSPSVRERPQVLGVLRAQAAQTTAMSGCLEFSLSVGDGPEGGLLVLQRWENKADLQRYLRSDLFQMDLKVMELSVSEPELHLYEVQACEGLEGVTEARDLDSDSTPPGA